MTDLQISLIAIGGTIVVGVISYNKWQEHKSRKSVQRAFSNDHDDVLMQPAAAADGAPDTRHEPSFAAPDTSAADADETADAVPADAAARDAADAQMPLPAQDLPLDPLIDCNIPLMLEGTVHGAQILPALQTLGQIGGKPIHFIGLREDQVWEAVRSGGTYSALQAGVQLANRSSALNELEYSELVMRLREVADQLGAEPDVPDMAEVVDVARELHSFITEHDAQLGINIRSNGAPWALDSLRTMLEKQGFEQRPDGRFSMPDGDGGNLFLLSANAPAGAATTARLTLLLEVPCVAPLRDGFGAMTACARVMAGKLDGSVVDDGDQILSGEALAEIAAQVAAFYDDMEAAEIPAGSNRAQRLFR
ncbi:cell division protein ZipA C-terminal FtsZ-binding domain-containing protein [Herminiimonas sp. CN]|uniref:cell division protein ZipA C-terminal FtsZ-binding domain-containing protein n=1 Tax=Herminiimonas sp. CN TaxID=1349818 RepID=UPI0004730DEB|nr:cell division protein ZipA C-terminal FtsZ-binding domain-containing protein [Herminiimonas sp. CN]